MTITSEAVALCRRTLREAKARRGAAEAAVRVATEDLHAAILEDLGVVVGVTVVMENRYRGRKGIVTGVQYESSSDKPWLRVDVLKKDGTPGKLNTVFYSWTMEDPTP